MDEDREELLTATAMSIRLREFSLPITLTGTELEERDTRP